MNVWLLAIGPVSSRPAALVWCLSRQRTSQLVRGVWAVGGLAVLRALKPGWQHQVTPSGPVPPPAFSKLGVWICKDSNEEFPGNTTLLGVPGTVFNL